MTDRSIAHKHITVALDRHSQPRLMPHRRVLLPGEFAGMISEPLSVYSERLTRLAVTMLVVVVMK